MYNRVYRRWDIDGLACIFDKNKFAMFSQLNFSTYVFLLTASICLFACGGEQLSPEPVIEAPLVALNYDSSNQDAPSLAGATTYEGAIRIPKDDLGSAVNGTISEVYFYIQELPQSASLKIYSGSTGDTPATQIYAAVISSEIEADTWNTHTLRQAVSVPDDDIWISVTFAHTLDQRTLGCDVGPANPNGDWLYSNSTGEWTRLNTLSPAISINWNIRAAVMPQ